jgi:hypothetical protein
MTRIVTEIDDPNIPSKSDLKEAPQANDVVSASSSWKGYQRVAFRVAFIFFILMSAPTNASWYTDLAAIDWTSLHYRDIYDLARFSSGFSFVGNTIFGNSLNGYANWIITLLVAVGGAVAWSLLDRRRKEYNTLYYWLLAIVRYRAGIGIIGFGFTKLFPVQMPYPSVGILNTDFGDLTAQKIYWLSIGIVPWYQVFAGVVECVAGAMLFFRGTAAIGAALLIGALGSITYVNFAYDGGVHGYASYFVLLGSFVLAYYIPRLYNLLILEKFTIPVNHYPSFSEPWQRYTRIVLKAGTIVVFIVVLFYIQWVNFAYDPYKQPSSKGVRQLRGYYNVAEFRINNVTLPYSPLDSVRWQEVTFEKWTSLSYKVNKATVLDLSNGGGSPMRDINRTFELTGVAGGRRVFYYEVDTVAQTLYLQDKNTAALRRNEGEGGARGERQPRNEKEKRDTTSWISADVLPRLGDEDARIHDIARSTRRTRGIPSEKAREVNRKKMILHYETADGQHVTLRGVNENNDSIYVVLDRADRQYSLSKSSLDAGKY